MKTCTIAIKVRRPDRRMRFWSLALLAAVIISTAPALGQDPTPAPSNRDSLVDTVAVTRAEGHGLAPRTVPIEWIGESIDFDVSFGIIPAGKARMAVLDTVRIGNQLALHGISVARSAKAFDIVFKVRDTVETWFDADSVYALRFRKKLREGPYRDEKLVEFDLANRRVEWWDDGVRKPDIEVEPRVQDVLSAGFKARLLPMAVGDTFAVKTHDVNKRYDLMVIVHRRESVETPAGTFDCFKVEPVLRSGGLFQKEKGARVYVWVTSDDRRIPVMMQTRVSFGAITALMTSYTPPANARSSAAEH
jgi:hypothetical protein